MDGTLYENGGRIISEPKDDNNTNKRKLCKTNASSITIGFMSVHGWMACLQQGTLVPGLGLGLDQQNLLLSQPLLDDYLSTHHSTENKPKTNTKSITKHSHTNNK